MRRLTLPLLAVLALTGFKPYPPDPGRSEPVLLNIVDRDQGSELPYYSQRGQRWVAGQNGHPYSLRLYNRSPERVLVVLSVDGLNVINGQVASPDQTGYVLEPWQRADITGWRKSEQEVAQFVFTDPGRSYANRTGRPDNIGVIGMAVFNEAPQFRPPVAPSAPMARERSQAAESADRSLSSVEVTGSSARAAAPAPALGTGHGARESSYAGSTDFRRASRIPVQQVAVRYDSERNLVARGIITRPRPVADEPQAFPDQFVPDPPPYRWR